MEVYNENNLTDYPNCYDYSLNCDDVVSLFGRAHKPYLKSCVNKYLFSCGLDFVFISPLRKRYRVLGRVTPSVNIVSRTVNYDVFFVGEFDKCLNVYYDIVQSVIFAFRDGLC